MGDHRAKPATGLVWIANSPWRAARNPTTEQVRHSVCWVTLVPR